MTNNNMSNGMKTFSGILVIVAVIAATAAIVRPIQQQIESVSIQLRNHTNQNNHPWGVIAEIAEIRQRFIEVETQFRGMRDVIEARHNRNSARIEKLERLGIKYTEESLEMIAILKEKIRQLEENGKTRN